MYVTRFYTAEGVLTNRHLAHIARVAGGFTLTKGDGGWVNDAGDLIREPAEILEVTHNGGPEGQVVTDIVMAAALAAGEDAVLRLTVEAASMDYMWTQKGTPNG